MIPIAPCSAKQSCRVHSNWQRINEALRTALAGISLAEMTHPSGRLVTLGGRPAAPPMPMPVPEMPPPQPQH